MTDAGELLAGKIDGNALFSNGDVNRHGNRDDERAAKQEELSARANVSQHDLAESTARLRSRAEVAASACSLNGFIRPVPSNPDLASRP